MKRLEKIFDDINIQLKEEKLNIENLTFVNIVSKLVKYVSYH